MDVCKQTRGAFRTFAPGMIRFMRLSTLRGFFVVFIFFFNYEIFLSLSLELWYRGDQYQCLLDILCR